MHRITSYKIKNGQTIQFVTVFFCAMNMINAGMEYGWTSAAFPELLESKDGKPPKITSEEGIWIATIALPGAVLGSLLNAFIWDIVGRKPIILLCAVLYTMTWIIIAVSNGAKIYFLARFLAGVSSGLALSAIPIYAGEISSPKIRGRLCAISSMCIVVGIFLVDLLSLFLNLVGGALSVLVFPILSFLGLLFMPESPYFYIVGGKDDKARKSLKIFSGKEDVDADIQRMKESVEERRALRKGVLKSLLMKENRRSILLFLFLRSGQPLCGITTLVYYSSVILGEFEVDLSVKHATLVFASAFLISVFIGVNLIDLIGRRPLILISAIGAAIGLILLGCLSHLKYSGVDISSVSHFPLVASVITIVFYGIGLQQVPYVMQGELLSAAIKAVVVAFGLMLFCTFSVLTSKYFQTMNDHGMPHYTFYTFAFFCVIVFIFLFFYLPETKGLSLEDVQIMMNQNKLYFKDVQVQ